MSFERYSTEVYSLPHVIDNTEIIVQYLFARMCGKEGMAGNEKG